MRMYWSIFVEIPIHSHGLLRFHIRVADIGSRVIGQIKIAGWVESTGWATAEDVIMGEEKGLIRKLGKRRRYGALPKPEGCNPGMHLQ